MADIILYDGVCALCNGFVIFVLHRDRRGAFRFASLQSRFAAAILARHGRVAADLDGVYVVVDVDTPAERLVPRSRAVLYVLDCLGGGWRWVARAGRLVPSALSEALYGTVAWHRYRIFGRYDACPLPGAEERARFIDP